MEFLEFSKNAVTKHNFFQIFLIIEEKKCINISGFFIIFGKIACIFLDFLKCPFECMHFSRYFENFKNINAFFPHFSKYMEELMHFHHTFSKYPENYAFLTNFLEHSLKVQENSGKRFKIL